MIGDLCDKKIALFAAALLAWICAGQAAAQAQPETVADPLVAVTRMPAQPAADGGVAIEVLGVDGKLATDAILVVVPANVATSSPEKNDGERFPDDGVRRAAARAVAEGTRRLLEHGRTRVPSRSFVAFAFAGEHFAQGVFIPQARPTRPARLRLQLGPPPDVTVLITDHDGRPLPEVHVGLQPQRGLAAAPVRRSGANGMAALFPPAAMDPARAWVAVLEPLRRPLHAPMPPAGAGPVPFQLPLCGSLRVAVLGTDGRPATAGIVAVARDEPGTRTFLPTRSEDGAAIFAFVEPGVDLAIRATVDGIAGTFSIQAPAITAGAETTATIDIGALPRVAFRVLDANGRPLARTDLRGTWCSKTCSGAAELRSDAEGRLELALPAAIGDEPELRIEWCPGRGEPCKAAATVKRQLAAGRNDLGDVQLEPAPLALAGTIVDTAGRPVAGISMSVRLDQSFRWITADARGRFECRTPESVVQKIQIVHLDDGWFHPAWPAMPSFDAGTTDALVVVQRAARLRVRMNGLPTTTRVNLAVICRPRSSGAQFRCWIEGADTALLVPAGGWDLTFHFDPTGPELLRVDDLAAAPGVETHDPRLMDLDWSRFASVVELKIEAPDGTPCDDCFVDFGGHRHLPERGAIAILGPKTGTPVRIEPTDACLQRADLSMVTGERTVRLVTAPRVVVRFTALPALPRGVALTATLFDREGQPAVGPPATFHQDGQIVFTVPRRGEYRLELALRRQSGEVLWVERRLPVRVEDAVSDVPIQPSAELQRAIDGEAARLDPRRGSGTSAR